MNAFTELCDYLRYKRQGQVDMQSYFSAMRELRRVEARESLIPDPGPEPRFAFREQNYYDETYADWNAEYKEAYNRWIVTVWNPYAEKRSKWTASRQRIREARSAFRVAERRLSESSWDAYFFERVHLPETVS